VGGLPGTKKKPPIRPYENSFLGTGDQSVLQSLRLSRNMERMNKAERDAFELATLSRNKLDYKKKIDI
jgi:hypothetical protein